MLLQQKHNLYVYLDELFIIYIAGQSGRPCKWQTFMFEVFICLEPVVNLSLLGLSSAHLQPSELPKLYGFALKVISSYNSNSFVYVKHNIDIRIIHNSATGDNLEANSRQILQSKIICERENKKIHPENRIEKIVSG